MELNYNTKNLQMKLSHFATFVHLIELRRVAMVTVAMVTVAMVTVAMVTVAMVKFVPKNSWNGAI